MAGSQATWPRSQALILCLLCFFLGRFTVNKRAQDVAATVKHQVNPPRKVLEAVQEPQPLPNSTYVGPSELTRLVEQSGLLQVKPPVTPGSSGNPSYTVAPFQVLSWQPRLLLFPALLDPERCEHIMRLAKDKLAPSGVAPTHSDQVLTPEQQEELNPRTSQGTFLSTGADPDGVLAWLEERIAAITQLPVEHGESFYVLRYQKNQYYESHLDSFDPKYYGPRPSQRVATVLTVLRAPEEGGETVFKREGAGGADRNVTEPRHCLPGDFTYKPRQGDALLFWGLTPDGKVDQQALHGACPVKRGEKWMLTKWIRSLPEDPPDDEDYKPEDIGLV